MARVWKFPENVDTDQMVPGRYAPYMRPDRDVGEAAFIEARPDFNRGAQHGDVIVAGHNFGCGSSREYAPLALNRRGIAAIIAGSFARIFFRNAVNLGIPLFVSAELVAALNDGDKVDVNVKEGTLSLGTTHFSLPKLAEFAQAIIDAGGVAAFVRDYGRFPGEPDPSADLGGGTTLNGGRP